MYRLTVLLDHINVALIYQGCLVVFLRTRELSRFWILLDHLIIVTHKSIGKISGLDYDSILFRPLAIFGRMIKRMPLVAGSHRGRLLFG
jgi:hypothetical protein